MIGFAIVGLLIAAADPFSPAGPEIVAVVGSVAAVVDLSAAAVVAADPAPSVAVAVVLVVAVSDPACSLCSFAVETGEGRVVVAISCSLTHLFSFYRTRIYPSRPYRSDRASAIVRSDRAR